MRTELGKIERVHFGLGGYQDAQLGLWMTISGKSWGVGHGICLGWSGYVKWTEHCKWTENDRDRNYATGVREIDALLREAKVERVDKLVGIPVEVTFEGNSFKSMRVLTEVL